jgi:hypothetical protein
MSHGSEAAAAWAVVAAPNAGTAIATVSRKAAASRARRLSMAIKRIKILRRRSCCGQCAARPEYMQVRKRIPFMAV